MDKWAAIFLSIAAVAFFGGLGVQSYSKDQVKIACFNAAAEAAKAASKVGAEVKFNCDGV